MRLWIARHGDAGAHISHDPKAERERGLTPDGVSLAEAVAAEMLSAGERPRAILASPYARSMQTADIYGAAFGLRVDQVDDLSPSRPLLRWLTDDFLACCANRRVMLVGHSDNLDVLMPELGGDNWPPLLKGEVRRVKIDRDSGDWSLRWMSGSAPTT